MHKRDNGHQAVPSLARLHLRSSSNRRSRSRLSHSHINLSRSRRSPKAPHGPRARPTGRTGGGMPRRTKPPGPGPLDTLRYTLYPSLQRSLREQTACGQQAALSSLQGSIRPQKSIPNRREAAGGKKIPVGKLPSLTTGSRKRRPGARKPLSIGSRRAGAMLRSSAGRKCRSSQSSSSSAGKKPRSQNGLNKARVKEGSMVRSVSSKTLSTAALLGVARAANGKGRTRSCEAARHGGDRIAAHKI